MRKEVPYRSIYKVHLEEWWPCGVKNGSQKTHFGTHRPCAPFFSWPMKIQHPGSKTGFFSGTTPIVLPDFKPQRQAIFTVPR